MLRSQTFMVMNRCNLACSYCYYEEGGAGYHHDTVGPGVYDAWLCRCRGLTDVEAISFTGGEPLLRPDFAELAEVATRHCRNVAVFTNATVVTRATAEMLARLGCEIHVSIDHVGAGIDDRVRGGTRATLRGLAHLRDAGVRTVQIVMVLTSRNVTDAGNVMAFAADAGFACELIAVSVPAVHPLSLMSLPLEQRRELAQLVSSRSSLLGRPLYYRKLQQYLLTGVAPSATRCNAGDNGIFVNSDGDIWVCAQRSRPSLGNIVDADPAQVIRVKQEATATLRPGRCVSLDCLVLV